MRLAHGTTTFSEILSRSLSAVGVISAVLLAGCATTEPKESTGPSPKDRTVQLQIFLDAQHFGPGVVDGSSGEFTSKALALYQQAHDLPPSLQPDVSTIAPYTTYTITAEDRSVLGTMASEPAELTKQPRLPYVDLGEVLGERFHTTKAFLRELNGGVDINLLPAGASVRVPNIQRPFDVAEFPSRYPAPPSSVAKVRRVLVDTHLRMVEVKENDQLLAAFPITPGSSDHPAPLGEWRVVGAVPWPWYRYDEGVLERGVRTDKSFDFPPGPNSPVGILWTGLNRPGVGIHGTSNPETIGRAGSHGCIRLSNWDAATFYTYVQKGMPVTIL
jgi:lipoprotein-anchoring transpeptidase ErfK/SrfK